MNERDTCCVIHSRGELLHFIKGGHVIRTDFLFNGCAEYPVLRAMVYWKKYGQLPKRVIQ